MAAPVRERQARLLADSRGSEPRARLAQASSRAEFLLRLSRTISAVQHPTRAMESLVTLLVEELVEFAQVTIVSGVRQATTGALFEGPLDTTTGMRADTLPPLAASLIRRGVPEDIPLPSGPVPERREAIEQLVPDPALADRLEAQGSESVLVLPLAARGRCFGLLALARTTGFGFDTGTQPFLEDLAQRIALALDANLVVAESRHVAAVLRRSLMPAEPPERPHLEVGTYAQVAHEHEQVGGDFFDLHGPDEDLTVLIGDVSGKGVEAAVHAKRIRNAVRTASMVDRDPASVLDLVNRVLVAEADEDSEVLATAVCLRLRPGDDGAVVVEAADAGHPSALVLRTDGSVEALPVSGPALALLPDAEYAVHTTRLEVGDTLVLYTDGVVEAGAPELFGEERLVAELAQLGGMSARVVVEQVAGAVSAHLGGDQHRDDIALVALRARTPSRRPVARRTTRAQD